MRRSVAILVLFTMLAIACAQTRLPDVDPLLPIPNARVPMEGVLSGGQPTREQIADAGRAGFRTVINLRSFEETGFEWEQEAVAQSGMRYIQIPIKSVDDLNRENVDRLDQALRESLQQGPVLLHCGSGNRIGAILALRAAWLEGADAEAALDYGIESGLTVLKSPTAELLGLPAAHPDVQ